MTTTPCPSCRGSGDELVHIARTGRARTRPCSLCAGSGEADSPVPTLLEASLTLLTFLDMGAPIYPETEVATAFRAAVARERKA
jgi:hypothetical protein